MQKEESKKVAVKMFLHGMQEKSLGADLDDLLKKSREPEHLAYAYREIRKELHVLSSLESPFVTELIGVKTSPYTCIMLELAPKGSLNSILKEYAGCSSILEPITLKCLALQVSQIHNVDTSLWIIGGGSGTASTATAVPKFDKWGLSRTKLGSEQFQYQPVLT